VANQEPKSANELAQDRTDLATGRTLMGADRSLMAWVRTALSMISFGFTIYKILQSFQQSGADLVRNNTPQTIGLFLTGLGTVSLIAGTIEYWHRIQQLRDFHTIKTVRPAFVMAIIMSVVGLLVFISIITKLL
jgi:putative membrane protein